MKITDLEIMIHGPSQTSHVSKLSCYNFHRLMTKNIRCQMSLQCSVCVCNAQMWWQR